MKDNRGNTINTPQLIANKFNEFFTNIGPSLATKITHSTVDHKSYLSGLLVIVSFLHLLPLMKLSI